MIVGYEDDHLLVVWKPHGMLTSGNDGNTLRRAVHLALGFGAATEDGGCAPEPCHRLDYGTSGWVIFGRNPGALAAMNQAFADRRILKRYTALVHGPAPKSLYFNLTLEGLASRTQSTCIARGRIAGAGDVSLMAVFPETGRTHQIRRHFSAVGHPIVGDDRFHREHPIYRGKGLFLCADGLAFRHPQTQNVVEVAALPSKKFMKIPFVHQAGLEQRQSLSSHLT